MLNKKSHGIRVFLLLLINVAIGCKSMGQNSRALQHQRELEQKLITAPQQFSDVIKPVYDASELVVIAYETEWSYVYKEEEDQAYLIQTLRINKKIKGSIDNSEKYIKLIQPFSEKGLWSFNHNRGAVPLEKIYFLKGCELTDSIKAYEPARKLLYMLSVDDDSNNVIGQFKAHTEPTGLAGRIINNKEVLYKGLNLVIGFDLNYIINPNKDWEEYNRLYNNQKVVKN